MDGTVIAAAIEEASPELAADMLGEFKTAWHKEEVEAAVNNRRMTSVNQKDHKAVEGVGRLRMRIDPTSFHYWGQKLGYNCWNDQQFLREYERDTPECRVKCGGTRIQVGAGGLSSGAKKKFSKKY